MKSSLCASRGPQSEHSIVNWLSCQTPGQGLCQFGGRPWSTGGPRKEGLIGRFTTEPGRHVFRKICGHRICATCRGSRVYSLAQQTLRDPFENGSWSRSTVDPGSWAPGSGLVHIWPEIRMNLYGHRRPSDDCVGRPLHPNLHPRCLSSIWQLISLPRNSRASSLCSQLLP